jgi:homocysteine S-methyltransferase
VTLSALEHGTPLVLDGGLASELERRGHLLDDALWSARLLLDDPEAVRAVHVDYLRAGADVVSTATYQASRMGFARRGLDAQRADRMIARAVALAIAARTLVGRGALIAGSLGPYGALLADGSEYRGDYPLSVDELVAVHLPRVDALVAAGVDLVWFETLPSLAEARAVAAIAKARPAVRFWAQLSMRDERSIARGEPIAEVGPIFDGIDNVLGVGLNCAAPETIEAGLARLGSARKSAAPNRGGRWDPVSRRFVGEAAGFDLGTWATRFLAAGATVVGGCCRTTPEDIARVRAAVDHSLPAHLKLNG